MSEFTARVARAGQIVIPKELRDLQAIEEGDYVVMTVKKVVTA